MNEILFNERLKNYRNSLSLLKKEFAAKLDISESYYNMVENGKRKPSKAFIYKLVSFSEKPEEYWIYGINKEEYIEKRDITKATKMAIQQIIEMDLIKDFKSLFNNNSDNSIAENLLIAALKADLSYLYTEKE